MTDVAREKAARLLKKRGSISSSASNEQVIRQHRKQGADQRSMSTISFMDDPGHEEMVRPPVRFENTYQTGPKQKFPVVETRRIIKDVLESYLSDEKYEPELCRQMAKSISDVVKAKVREMMVPRYKVICIVHIGQLRGQGLRMGSRCLWDAAVDTFATHEFKNNSLYAVGTVYGVYYE